MLLFRQSTLHSFYPSVRHTFFGKRMFYLVLNLKYLNLADVSVTFCHFPKWVMVHIRIKGEVGVIKLDLALQ